MFFYRFLGRTLAILQVSGRPAGEFSLTHTSVNYQSFSLAEIKSPSCIITLTYPPSPCSIYASVNWVSIGSDTGTSPGWRRASIWTNADISLIRLHGTYFNEILFEIQILSFKKMRLNISSAKWRQFRRGRGDELRAGPCINGILGHQWAMMLGHQQEQNKVTHIIFQNFPSFCGYYCSDLSPQG